MKQLLIILLLLLLVSSVDAQTIAIPFKGSSLTTDQFGFYYEISDTEIKKYKKDGKIYRTYSNNVLGVIANVDVSNPYKIVVYFRDFTKILILDNFLTPSSDVIDLTTIDLDAATLVCRSYNNGTWYYNSINFELVRKDQDMNTTNSSSNLANLLGKNIQPNFLIEYNNKVYLNDSVHGVLVFDIYGTYLKTLPIYGLIQFQVKDKFLIYSNNQAEIEIYDFFTLEKRKYKPLIYNTTSIVRVENEVIFILNKNNQLFIDKIED